MATDMLSPANVIWHGTRTDLHTWGVTKDIAAVELAQRPGGGVRLELSPYNPAIDGDSWLDRFPVGGGPGPGGRWDGTIRWSLALAAEINNRWHGAAFHEMWHDRQWTGAPLLTDWLDGWGDARGVFGAELRDHRPKAGDRIALMAAAGQLRLNKESAPGNTHMLTVRERSNMVVVTLQPNALYTFDTAAPPIVVGPPVDVPHNGNGGPPVAPGGDNGADVELTPVMAMLVALRANVAELSGKVDELAKRPAPSYAGQGSVGPFRGSVTLEPRQ